MFTKQELLRLSNVACPVFEELFPDAPSGRQRLIVKEQDDAYDVALDVAGTNPSDISVRVEDRLLIISGGKASKNVDNDGEVVKSGSHAVDGSQLDSDAAGGTVSSETPIKRASSSDKTSLRDTFAARRWERSLRLTREVDADNIAAEVVNGMLYIKLPKQMPQTRSIEVNVAA